MHRINQANQQPPKSSNRGEGLEEGKGAVAPASRNIRESRRRLKQLEPSLGGGGIRP